MCAEWIYQYNMCKKYENHFLMFLTEKKNDTIGRFRNSKISENQNIDIDNQNNNGSKRNNENILMRDIYSSIQQDIIRNETHLSMEVDAQIHLVRYKIFYFFTSKVLMYILYLVQSLETSKYITFLLSVTPYKKSSPHCTASF